MKKAFLSGNEAVAQGAFEAGLHVACAYPGTPSTEILESIAKYDGIDMQWSVNEKVAYEVAYGAAIGGARALYACKHVGLNVAMDPLMTSSYTGIRAGFVIVVCDDPGMHSSQNEQDTRWVGIYSKMPILEPSGPAEAKEFIKEAFEISEEFDTPVMVRMTTRISHTKEDVAIGERKEVAVKDFEIDMAKYVMVPKSARARHKFIEERIEKMAAYSETSSLNKVEMGDTKLGFVTGSVSYNYLKEVYPDASYLKLGFLYPFCDEKIREFASKVDEVVVVEELDPFVENHLKEMGIKVSAKDKSFMCGELLPGIMKDVVEGKPRVEKAAAARKPVLCPACPHRAVFVTLNKLKVIVTGDIGCYTLAALPPLSALHTCVCMGGGFTVHEGMRRAHPDGKIVGVMGDSTFVHSGITGLINAVYNKCKGVLIVMDNRITAMTGGQENPSTGLTIKGEPTNQLIIEDVCKACGADNVDVIDPLKMDEMHGLFKKRLLEDALSVVITRSPCKLLDRERMKQPEYKKDLCKKCGICVKIDCPALTEAEEGYIKIDENLCAGCNICVQACPFEALTD
jgi:indolepyruvate ferredoxin oxidoreductase alpha subunit